MMRGGLKSRLICSVGTVQLLIKVFPQLVYFVH